MAALDDLLDDIFDGKKPALYRECEGWLRDSLNPLARPRRRRKL